MRLDNEKKDQDTRMEMVLTSFFIGLGAITIIVAIWAIYYIFFEMGFWDYNFCFTIFVVFAMILSTVSICWGVYVSLFKTQVKKQSQENS